MFLGIDEKYETVSIYVTDSPCENGLIQFSFTGTGPVAFILSNSINFYSSLQWPVTSSIVFKVSSCFALSTSTGKRLSTFELNSVRNFRTK